jgi:RNA polymerase sigma factor for flagellar operon FliA
MPARKPGNAAKAWKAYNDVSFESQHQFIERYLPLVKTVVDRIRVSLPPGVDVDDLQSIGLTGLVAAVHKYDPERTATFVAFATLHIRGAVMDELRRMDWMSRGAREKARNLKEVMASIEQRVGRPATEEDVRAELLLTAIQYARLLEEVKPVIFVELDGECRSQDSESMTLHELIPDDGQASADEQLEKKELIELVANRIKTMPEIPKKVLAMYYFENMRISEIAAAFNLTEGRISQIHTQAVLSLRSFVEGILKNPASPTCC